MSVDMTLFRDSELERAVKNQHASPGEKWGVTLNVEYKEFEFGRRKYASENLMYCAHVANNQVVFLIETPTVTRDLGGDLKWTV